VQQTRRHWPVVSTDNWHRHPRHYYMPLTWYRSTSAKNVTNTVTDQTATLQLSLNPSKSKAVLKRIPKPWSVSLKVSNEYDSLSASCTWGCTNCSLWQNYMAMKGSNKPSWHSQGTVKDPLTSTEVTCLFIYSWHHMLLLHAIITSRAPDISLSSCHRQADAECTQVQGYYFTNDTVRLQIGRFW